MGVASRLRRHPYALGSFALLIAVIGGGTLALSRPWRSTAGAQGSVPASPRIPVVAAAARTRDARVYLNGLGSVTPLNTVTVRSRVDGELIGVHFQEGQMVRSGDLLAEIDPRPFQAQLTQFEGQLERDQALLDNARLDLKRFQVLVTEARGVLLSSLGISATAHATRRAIPTTSKALGPRLPVLHGPAATSTMEAGPFPSGRTTNWRVWKL